MWLGGTCVAGGMHVGGRVWYACPSPGLIPRDTVGQCADGTHPTGMHNYLRISLVIALDGSHVN